MQYATRKEALSQSGDVRVHYKGGVYRKLSTITVSADFAACDVLDVPCQGRVVTATITDAVAAGTLMALYEHLYPHAHRHYLRPDAMFEGALESGVVRFQRATTA